jgi:hypothetical protein
VDEVGIRKVSGVKIKHVVFFIAIALFVFAPFVSYVHRNAEPTFIARDESPIGGTIGYTVQKTPCTPKTTIVVYNGTVNDPSADWHSQGHLFESYNDAAGVKLELSGTTTTAYGYTYDSFAQFIGYPTLPLMNYTEVCFSINIIALQGSVNASLKIGYWAWPDYYWYEAGENSTSLENDQSMSLAIKLQPNVSYNLTSDWIIRTSMVVEIATSERSQVLLGEVLVSAKSNENLFPVIFDIQAPDGESLFLNPYMKSLGVPQSELDMKGDHYPAVRLTRTGNESESSMFGPRCVNNTIYLAEGVYEGTAGWASGRGSFSLMESAGNISFIIGQNESTFVFIRIPTFRLFLNIFPSFAYSKVTVRNGNNYDYIIYYPLQNSDYLYIPSRTSFGVSISPLIYVGSQFVDSAHHDYRQATAGMIIQTNGTSCVRVTVVFSQFSLFGVILDWGQILGILGAALLLLLLIHGAAKRSLAGFRKDYNLRADLLPVSLYYITMLFPWVTYTFDTNAAPFNNVSGAVMVPLFTTIWWTPQSQLTPAPSGYLLPNIIALVFLYWIPVFYFSYLIATRTNSISYELLDKATDPLFRLGVIGGPFIIGCYYAWLCIIGLCFPSIGLIAALFTLPSWFVASWLRTRHNQAHANHVVN